MIASEEWTKVKLGDVARQVSEHVQHAQKDGIARYVGLEHLDTDELGIERWGSVVDGTTFTRRFRSGHLLFGRRRAYQRKAAVPDFDGICSGDLIVIEADPNRLDARLLPHIVHTDRFFELAIGTSAGSLSPRTKWKSLAEYEFMLPPLDRQIEIIEVLEASREVHGRLDRASSSATALWRSLIRKHIGPDQPTKPLADLVDVLDHLRVPLNGEERAGRQGPYPYYGANGVLDSIDDYRLEGDFVLLAEDGGYWGPGESSAYMASGRMWVNNHAHVLLPSGDYPGRLLRALLNEMDLRPWVVGTTRGKLNAGSMARIPVPQLDAEEVALLDNQLGHVEAAKRGLREAAAFHPTLRAALSHCLLAPEKLR